MPRILVLACMLLLMPAITQAVTTPPDTSRNVFARGLDRAKLQKARNLQLEGRITEALEAYRDAYAKNKSSALANFRIGECLVTLRQFREAVPYLEKALRNGPEVDKRLYINLGIAYHRIGELDKAEQYYAEFLERAKNKIDKDDGSRYLRQVRFAKNIEDQPAPVKSEPMGNAINSPFVDSNPALSPDGKTFAFTSRRPENKGGQTDGSGQYFEDVWMSTWDSVNGKWGDAEPMPGRINTPSYDASLCFSADGNEFYIYRNLGYEGSGELFYSRKSKSSGKWGSPKSLGEPVNSTYFETGAALTADGKKLFFISERKGGQGQADIWMSERVSRSTWGEPVNLGATINTPLDEISVWCDAEGTTLFFASDGHLGVGGYDIYKSHFANGSWSAPENLGFPINTVMDERHFTFSFDGKTAYYITESDLGQGSYDIFEVQCQGYDYLKANSGFATHVKVTGTVSSTNGKPSAAELTFTDDATGVKFTTSTATKGTYELELPAGASYTVSASGELGKVETSFEPEIKSRKPEAVVLDLKLE